MGVGIPQSRSGEYQPQMGTPPCSKISKEARGEEQEAGDLAEARADRTVRTLNKTGATKDFRPRSDMIPLKGFSLVLCRQQIIDFQ